LRPINVHKQQPFSWKVLTSQVKSSHLYLGRVAPSAIGWYQRLRLHDKKIQNLKITAKLCTCKECKIWTRFGLLKNRNRGQYTILYNTCFRTNWNRLLCRKWSFITSTQLTLYGGILRYKIDKMLCLVPSVVYTKLLPIFKAAVISPY